MGTRSRRVFRIGTATTRKSVDIRSDARRRDARVPVDLALERHLYVVLPRRDAAVDLPEAEALEAAKLARVRLAGLAVRRREIDVERYALSDLLLLSFGHRPGRLPALAYPRVVNEEDARRLASGARVARVGTVDERGRVHLVPIVFALDVDTLYSSTDAGPRLAKRLRNLQLHPSVTVLIDLYDEDWSRVWWVRARGHGRVVSGGPEFDRAYMLLREKYPQYAGAPADGPVMAVDVDEWSGWSYSSSG
jgi:PPOX class probable F420-dependent enzyme